MQRMQYEGRGYRYTFQRARVAVRKYPRSRDEKSRHFCGYHLHWLTSLETSRHFRIIALWLGNFLAKFRESLGVVARQLAPKCRNFSNVTIFPRHCKWPNYDKAELVDMVVMDLYGLFLHGPLKAHVLYWYTCMIQISGPYWISAWWAAAHTLIIMLIFSIFVKSLANI